MINNKVYIEIVKQLREMIAADGLQSGDKLPSERELTERLNVGRSSVREALRALELLGIIETKRGEGTYIRDFRGHQLVPLLSTFILQDEKAKRDVLQTKNLIEMDCLRLALRRMTEERLKGLQEWVKSGSLEDDEFFYQIVEMSDNHLFFKMWLILKDFYYSLHTIEIKHTREEYLFLIEALAEKNEEKVLDAYRRLRNLSVFNDIY